MKWMKEINIMQHSNTPQDDDHGDLGLFHVPVQSLPFRKISEVRARRIRNWGLSRFRLCLCIEARLAGLDFTWQSYRQNNCDINIIILGHHQCITDIKKTDVSIAELRVQWSVAFWRRYRVVGMFRIRTINSAVKSNAHIYYSESFSKVTPSKDGRKCKW